MSAELEDRFKDIEVRLIADGKGIFDVTIDGTLVFSKYRTDRFPEPGEITKLLS